MPMKAVKVTGTREQRMFALMTKADIYIINRENVKWLYETGHCRFDMIVVDELSGFKSRQSQRFRALLKMRPYAHRVVGLTATPSGNGLMDLWAEYRVIDLGERLGRFIGQYRNKYFKPGRRNGDIVYEYIPLPFAEKEIYDKISDITVSMKACDYLDMPDLIKSTVKVRMSQGEKGMYDEFRREMIARLGDEAITAANAASLSNKLCQMANGAVYSDDGKAVRIHNRKLDALEDIIESMNGKPLLVAYRFRHDLTAICERLDKLKIKYDLIKTPESIKSWNSGELTVGLIHPASAGHGLNLQSGGSTLVWYGLTWSLELYEQTNARLYRQGQKSRTVVIEHIVTENTIDEYILKALESKKTTQNNLIKAVSAVI